MKNVSKVLLTAAISMGLMANSHDPKIHMKGMKYDDHEHNDHENR